MRSSSRARRSSDKLDHIELPRWAMVSVESLVDPDLMRTVLES